MHLQLPVFSYKDHGMKGTFQMSAIVDRNPCNTVTFSGLPEMNETTCFSTKWLQAPSDVDLCLLYIALVSEDAWALKVQQTPRSSSAPSPTSIMENLSLNKWLYICPCWQYLSGMHSLLTFWKTWTFVWLKSSCHSPDCILLLKKWFCLNIASSCRSVECHVSDLSP